MNINVKKTIENLKDNLQNLPLTSIEKISVEEKDEILKVDYLLNVPKNITVSTLISISPEKVEKESKHPDINTLNVAILPTCMVIDVKKRVEDYLNNLETIISKSIEEL
ncbi:hypothetical protein [Anaerosphaera multitolerans]|uniref:Uncharacterized protein n=1 Tax=Anaerosphaera multitolerans TaxID=2487351 RepID=A0A437S7N2_9FIRM|nr:hypothetical protein [Anaerosphaera multitolerans]RVU55076.1 hypothetical protein EF514_04090 [Anaerosphaera multitolerans]